MNIFKRIIGAVTAAAIMLSSIPMTASAESISVPKNEATEFADNLGAAWNLGNSFDSADCTWLSNELDYETGWCGAKATKELISEIKKMGFDTIRVPVSWHNHVDKNFKISRPWLDRVQEVIDWCYDEGLNVVLNIHHDVKKGYYYPTPDQYETSEKYITAVWKQLAERFADYDEKLIFETINEPRATDTNYEWWFPVNNPSKQVKESVDCINRLNQAALDTIRSAGGKNKNRFVLISGYDNSIDGITVNGFEMPKDSVKDRLIVNVHLYTKSENTYKQVFDKVYNTYVKKGIPAFMSEYNLDAGPNKYEGGSAEFLSGMVSYGRERGISCAIWDNNDIAYKLIDRKTVKWTQQEVAKAIVEAGKPSGLNGGESGKTDAESKTEITVKAEQDGFYADISWNKADGASKYRVYRADSKTGKKKLIKTTESARFTDKGVKLGGKYYYFVKYYDSGTKKWSNYSKAETISMKKSGAETEVKKASSKSDVKITWSKISGGDYYRVYRAETKDGKKTKLSDVKKLAYTDKTAKAGKTYYYFVKVYDIKTKTWSSYSEPIKVKAPK